MKLLEKVTLKQLLKGKKNCKVCLGKGYILLIRKDLDATKFREVRPCPRCIKQVVKVEEK